MHIELDARAMQQIASVARQFPREMQRANGRAASVVRGRMRKAMKAGGGVAGVPAFAKLNYVTIGMRNGHTEIGGVLADSSRIVMFRSGKGQYIGWPDNLETYGSLFQSASSYMMDNATVAYLHRHSGLGSGRISHTYNRPARPVIEPLVAAAAPEYPKWIMGAATKLIDKTLKKRGF